jgi:16S rRNA (cytosine967-C5)-methyltransferase
VNQTARILAWEVLYQVENDGAYSNLLLPRRLRESNLSDRDRAFTTELVYGSLRKRGFCDYFLARVSDRPLEKIDLKLLIGLRLGTYQLKVLEMPVHAAINESVELVKRVAGKSSSAFANAVLRRVAEDGEAPEKLSDKFSHPEWIISAFRDCLRDEEALITQLEADNAASAPTLIAWPGRSKLSELVEFGAVPITGSKVAATFSGNPGEIDAVRERRAGVQDLGSQIVVENFYATTSSSALRWLDLCAGPGGKAAYLDSLIEEGELVANEISKERAQLVSQVVRRGKVISFDGRKIPEELGNFDRILIDAPCTGIGALRRRPEVRWRRKPSDLRALTQLQSELLAAAALRLNPGGVIGYATCSPHLAETKFQIRDFLKVNPNFRRVRVAKSPDKDGDMQLWPFRDQTDAMFLSLVEKFE